jgi:glutaredoxin
MLKSVLFLCIKKEDVCPMAEVIIYSADWCGPCGRAKGMLDLAGIEYEVRDAQEWSEDEQGRPIQSIPHIVVDGQFYGPDVQAAIAAAQLSTQELDHAL